MSRIAASLLASLLVLAAGSGAAVTEPRPDALRHWAFQPPRDTHPPMVRNVEWARTELDPFVLARFEEEGIAPAPPADPRTLIRRMTFDLTGLPPTSEEVDAFAAAAGSSGDPPCTVRADAVEQLIDRLLASPRYGERWGRHWLDVARYSDTKGYVYAREERRFVHAHSYRDWVIRAFNEDLPFDRFLMLQIAADQLVPAGSPDLAAMGFLTGGRRFIGVTHDIIDDRIDVVTRGTMALTVQCARCHDHKYDPIPTQDYYSLYGVFHGGDDRLVPLAQTDDGELAKRQKSFDEMLAKRRREAGERLRARIADYLAAQLELAKYPEEGFDQILGRDDLIPASVRRWRDYLHTTRSAAHPIFGPWHALAALPEDGYADAAPSALSGVLGGPDLNSLVAAAFRTPPDSMRDAAARYGRLFADAERQSDAPGAAALIAFLQDPHSPTVVPETGIVNNEGFFPTSEIEELWKLQGEVDRRLLELGTPAALVLEDREPEPEPRVFNRGSPSRPGVPVPRRFLEVLSGPQREPFREGSGRLELARAIASPDNPLTARVMVNRIWQHHFGIGLVKTSSDFGRRAEPPSHPELLDWLARRFIADGWSVKALHRVILSSATYQQASRQPPGGEASTRTAPFPMRRLDFEEVRDAMLAASGELNLTLGGMPSELLAADNHRRTVYAIIDRQFLPGTFRTFDFANPDIHVAVRHETTVPQQALFFLNGPFVAGRAKALAGRVEDAPPGLRVQRLHRAVYQRDATEPEIAAALRFIADASADLPPPPPPPRPTPWQYGAGEYDETGRRVKSFTPLPHFTGSAWQGAETWPGGESGWAQITAEGGHPGNALTHACIRRWVAPRDATVSITGVLKHEPEPGDGVRAFVVSSRHGELKAATVHHSNADMTVADVRVQAGDTLDFIVHIGGTLNSDQFLWSPVLTGDGGIWDARADFTGPTPEPTRLTPWEQYAQVLLLANEFAFVD